MSDWSLFKRRGVCVAWEANGDVIVLGGRPVRPGRKRKERRGGHNKSFYDKLAQGGQAGIEQLWG